MKISEFTEKIGTLYVRPGKIRKDEFINLCHDAGISFNGGLRILKITFACWFEIGEEFLIARL